MQEFEYQTPSTIHLPAPNMPSPLVTGIIAPTQVFFHKYTEELDIKTIGKHAVRLVRAGVAGIATNGSNGKAVYLPAEE